MASTLFYTGRSIPERNASTGVLICAAVGCSFALVAVVLRVLTRLSRRDGQWMMDDSVAVLTMVSRRSFGLQPRLRSDLSGICGVGIRRDICRLVTFIRQSPSRR